LFQEGGLAGGVLPALLPVKVAGEMLGVAAEGLRPNCPARNGRAPPG
jgi:hypothetical protein